MSRPRSAQSPALSLTLRMPSDAWLARLPACSVSWLRSSEPAFGANSMPRPAPSTVPVNSPITKLLPPLPSFSKRSYPSAIVRPPEWLSSRFGTQQALQRHAGSANDAHKRARLRPHVRADTVGGVVDPIDRRVNRVVDPLRLF